MDSNSISPTLALIIPGASAYIFQEYSRLAELVRFKLDVSSDFSLTEIFNHGLAFLTATLFLICFFQTRSRAMLFLSALYSFIWFDDAAKFHELVGSQLAEVLDFQPMFGLRAQDYGELLAWSGAGLVMGAIFVWACRDLKASDRGVLLALFICIGALVFFAVVVDMLHIVFNYNLVGIIEDGGEVLTMVAAATLAIGISRNATMYYAASQEKNPSGPRRISG